MKKFEGKILFLDRSDINTDEIIPARYLTELSKEALKPYLFEDLNLEGFDQRKDIADKGIILTRSNFGCGSSREHAPWAIEQNGINVVIAESFARIFRQNMFNCGMVAIELDKEIIDNLFEKYSGSGAYLTVDVNNGIIILKSIHISGTTVCPPRLNKSRNFRKMDRAQYKTENSKNSEEVEFRLTPFDKKLVNSGGWLNYADEKY